MFLEKEHGIILIHELMTKSVNWGKHKPNRCNLMINNTFKEVHEKLLLNRSSAILKSGKALIFKSPISELLDHPSTVLGSNSMFPTSDTVPECILCTVNTSRV